MKVAYVVSRFPHLYQTFVRREIREVVAQGADVTVFPLVPNPGGPHRELAAQCTVPATVHPLPRRRHRLPVAARPIVRKLFRDTLRRPVVLMKSLASVSAGMGLAQMVRAREFDHIHAHWSSYPATAAWTASVITGVPFSFAFHAYDIYATRILVPEKIRQAAFAVANCHFTVQTLGKFCVKSELEKVELVYNGLEIPASLPLRDSPDPPHALAIGQLVATKGFSVLLEACQRLKQGGVHFRATIIGDGPLRRRLQSECRKRGLQDTVTFAGALPDRETRQLINAASVVAVPSLEAPEGQTHDGLPNVVIEAQAAGVPVVASALYGIPDAISDGQTGLLVPPGDATALADALRTLLENPTHAARLAEAAFAQARSMFDVHRNVERLVQRFRGAALAGNRGSAFA